MTQSPAQHHSFDRGGVNLDFEHGLEIRVAPLCTHKKGSDFHLSPFLYLEGDPGIQPVTFGSGEMRTYRKFLILGAALLEQQSRTLSK